MAQSTTNLGKIHVFPSESLYNQFKDIIADNDLALLKDDGAYIVAANLAQNGYVKFSNGLILQWGIGKTEKTTSFHIAFNTVFSLVALPGTGTSTRNENLYFKSLNTTGFFATMSWGSQYVDICYIAIGK